MPDLERLQSALDDIAGTVEWAEEWIKHLEEEEIRFDPMSDLPVLQAEAARLRAVADALLPGRVRDPATGRRWYLAPDDVAQREAQLDETLDDADTRVNESIRLLERARRDKEQSDRREAEEDRERSEARARDRATVIEFLKSHGPATLAEIRAATGMSEGLAEITAFQVAKRGRDRRYRLTET